MKNPNPLPAKLRCLEMKTLWILRCAQNDIQPSCRAGYAKVSASRNGTRKAKCPNGVGNANTYQEYRDQSVPSIVTSPNVTVGFLDTKRRGGGVLLLHLSLSLSL